MVGGSPRTAALSLRVESSWEPLDT